MATIHDLLKVLESVENTPEGYGHLLRMDLADLILMALRDKGWTQKQLAEACDMKESFISRIVGSQSNCTFDVAGRLLFALGVKPTLQSASPASTGADRQLAGSVIIEGTGTAYGDEKIQRQGHTKERFTTAAAG